MSDHIADACEQAGCSEESTKRHRRMYVEEQWNPHPSTGFKNWWARHEESRQGIGALEACNCRRYMDEYLEQKGIVSQVTPEPPKITEQRKTFLNEQMEMLRNKLMAPDED